MYNLRTAARLVKRRPSPGLGRLSRLLKSAGIETLRTYKLLPRCQWIHWLPATVHGKACYLTVASRPGMLHCWLSKDGGAAGLRYRETGCVEVFMDMRGAIRVHSLDTLGYVMQDETELGQGFEPPGGDCDAGWITLMKAAPVWEGP